MAPRLRFQVVVGLEAMAGIIRVCSGLMSISCFFEKLCAILQICWDVYTFWQRLDAALFLVNIMLFPEGVLLNLRGTESSRRWPAIPACATTGEYVFSVVQKRRLLRGFCLAVSEVIFPAVSLVVQPLSRSIFSFLREKTGSGEVAILQDWSATVTIHDQKS